MTGSAINIDGDIVGTAYTGFDVNGNLTGGHGFLYHDLKVIDLGPGAATAINGLGEVLGYSLDSSGKSTPFLYQNGSFTTLPANSYVLNDLGQILIQVTGAVEIREPNGTIVSHAVNNGYFFVALAISDLGQVIARDFVNALKNRRNQFGDFYNQVLLVQPGGAYRIVARNRVDYFYDEGDATLYNPDGKSVYLGNLLTEIDGGAPPGSDATGINSFGTIVGFCRMANGQVSKGFVYLNASMYDLNALATPTPNGLTIISAQGVNDLGQIVATATDADGGYHAVILTVAGSK
jgi:probable HAF family extracellular repeat protein